MSPRRSPRCPEPTPRSSEATLLVGIGGEADLELLEVLLLNAPSVAVARAEPR